MPFSSDTTNVALVNELARRLNDNTRRVRMLEEKIISIDSRVNVHDQRIMDTTKQINAGELSISNELTEIKDKLANIALDLQNMKSDMRKSATVNDMREVQDYIELINPITSKFATKGEVAELVREELRKQARKMSLK